MIYLWLDDVRPMPFSFTHHAKTAQEAIEILKTKQVIECSLDHDLGDGCGTGYEVAKWIEEQAHFGLLPQLVCYIHSQNSVGVENMNMAIQSAYKAWEN